MPRQLAFFVYMNGQQAGPFPQDGLQRLVDGGQLTRDTLVWKQGMANWTDAGDVPDLASLFQQMPPPLPPP